MHIDMNGVGVFASPYPIRRDRKRRRNGEACRAVIENIMFVSFDIFYQARPERAQEWRGLPSSKREYHVSVFDIKFITRGQNQRRNGEACRASPTCFWSSLINLISKLRTWFSVYHALLADLMAKIQRNKCKEKTILVELADVANA